ncbi:fibronectin type III domain-containing protein [Longitalea arenae]|uniref:fibronectin type III domain-containing protein n=1 Tax=Longitalea arenae TaxID=2812558 RepID=UPI001967059A|nr:fibronectin type III domain-containing protein [Longitalea arenae]
MIRALRLVQLTILLLLMQLPLHAQVYPVQVVSQLLPPYTLNISEYYQGNQERLVVLLTNTDLTKPALQVRLKMSIQGQNAKLRSRDGVYYPPITLDAGVPQRITLADLAPYFNLNNLELEGITRSQFQQSQKLPEGFYQFCFEAYEYNTNRLVGRSHCAMAWISLLDPPLLNLPRKTESIAFKDPSNIIFQWTPRNMGSPTAAFNTEYEFTLVELWDNGISPEAAFGTMQPLYRTTTQATTLLYGPAEPLLIPGKRYGWRIRAQNSNGSQNTDAYRNNGYSEIFWFTYQRDCPMPFNVQSEVSGGRATITWNAALQQTRFSVDYREKGQTANQWYTVNSSTNRVMLYDLKKDKQYEYRVGAYCDVNLGATFPANGAVYSDIKSFYIDGSSVDLEAGCNILQPELKIANRNPIQTLMSGDVITAGDFPVRLITVQGQSNFSGTGYITIPFLGKVAVKVRFSGITVNTDKQLIGGVIETTYDKESKQIVDVTDFTGDPKSVAILRDIKDHIPDPATAPLDDLLQFAEKLADVSPNTIDNALALTPAEKTQLKQNIAAMNEAREVLEDKNATPEQKAAAEQKLRDAVKQAAPIVEKLGETVGKGLQSVVSKWFNSVREFLKGYRGTESDKQQAAQWHKTTDSLVAVLMQSKNVPNSLLDSLNKASQAAAPAWLALENATTCNTPDISQAPKGPYWFDDVLNDYSCYVALGNAQYDVIDKVFETSKNNLFDSDDDLVIDELVITNSLTDAVVYTPDAKEYKIKGTIVNYTIDVNGALSAFTHNGNAYVAAYTYDRKTNVRTGFAGYVILEKAKAMGDKDGFFSYATAKANGYMFDIEKNWELQERNADKVKMVQHLFDKGKILKNNTPELRKEILELVKQLPDAVFRIEKDPNYIQFFDLIQLRDHLKQQLNSIESAVKRMQALIDAYKIAKGDRKPEILQILSAGIVPELDDARCKITKELESWNVTAVKYNAERASLGIFEKLGQQLRLDLLQMMYESPDLNTTAWNQSGYNCFLTNFGEETVIALLKYAPNPDKAAIIGYFNRNKEVLPRLYKLIDNKGIIDDKNFDNFIRELIIANAVYLAAKQAKPNDNAPTIVWSISNAVDIIKGVSFTSDGKMVFNHVNYKLNAKNIIIPMLLPAATLLGVSLDQSKPVDPLDVVNLVIPEPSEKYWPELKDATKFPYTIQIPAISAAWMINKTTNDKIQLGIDIALIALSAGEYAAAKGALQYIWISAKIAVPLASELMKTEAGIRTVNRYYGVYDTGIPDSVVEARRKKAQNFIDNYNTFTTFVNLGAMGEGMYSIYKSVRGSAAEMRSLSGAVNDEVGLMGKIESDLTHFDDAMPDNLKLGRFANVTTEAAMAEKLVQKGFGKLANEFKAMKQAEKARFMDDFTNASDDVLKALNKENSELMQSWKAFRQKYPNEILCN